MEHYRREYSGVQLLSPDPIAISIPDRAIMMSLIPGNELDQFISGDALIVQSHLHHSKNKHELKRIKNTTFYRVGQLLKIKDTESLAHGDFLLRHVFADLDNLGIIDMENSTNMNSMNVFQEKQKFIDLILNCHSQSPRFQSFTQEAIHTGYNSISNPESVIRDLIYSTQKDLGFTSTRFS